MPFIGRGSLTQEFYDVTSSALLKQPEPQYFHAQCLKIALNMELESVESLGLPVAGRDGIGADGAPYSEVDEDRLILDDPIMSEMVVVVPEMGKVPGHTVRINRPSFANTTYTLASREVPNGSVISTTPVNVASEQTSLTLRRTFGPYDAANSRVAPYGVDRFDASLPVHKVASLVSKHLKRDRDRFLDTVMVLLGDLAANVVYPKGMSVDDSSTVAGDYPMDWETVLRVEKTLDDANVPVFGNGRRIFVATTLQLAQLQQDALFVKLAAYQPPINPVLQKSYYKSVGNFDFYKSTTLRQVNNTSTIPIQYGQAFGPGMWGYGTSRMPGLVTSTADNFGEHALVGWMAYECFGNLDNRFGVSARSS